VVAPIDTFQMETNFQGLIQLLAKHLYSEPDVFVRELVQNAHDGIVRRIDVDPNLAGRIQIDYDLDARTITFRDNGIGMNRQDIRTFLAVIGSTGTGTARKDMLDEGKGSAFELIGQFGIGLLSAFVVASKVIVRTRKLAGDAAFAWHNSGSADCELYADDKPDIGTEIIVSIRDDYSFILDGKRLEGAIRKYCDFIRFPIMLNDQGPVNVMEGPSHRPHWTSQAHKESAYKSFLNARYPDIPIDVIPIEIETPFRASGALYISDRHVPDVNTTGVIDIYVRRVFIRGNDNAFLPPWAKFVRGIIDSPDLQPRRRATTLHVAGIQPSSSSSDDLANSSSNA
jgi:molecular chaperone HtpG